MTCCCNLFTCWYMSNRPCFHLSYLLIHRSCAPVVLQRSLCFHLCSISISICDLCSILLSLNQSIYCSICHSANKSTVSHWMWIVAPLLFLFDGRLQVILDRSSWVGGVCTSLRFSTNRCAARITCTLCRRIWPVHTKTC